MLSNNNIDNNDNNKVVAGFIIVAVGVVMLLRTMGFVLPHWLFTWPTLLIVIGLFSGFRNNFRKSSWLVLVVIGSFFLLQDFITDIRLDRYFWPLAVIGFGILYIFKSGFKKTESPTNNYLSNSETISNVDFADIKNNDEFSINSVFSSAKQHITSKNFKGGKVAATFGSAEIELTKCDFYGTAIIYVEIIFGSTRLIVPPNWVVKNETNGVLSNINDKRIATFDETKILVLKGSCVFGGVDVVTNV